MGVREESNERRRGDILDAAERIVSEKGIGHLNIRDVARASGCSTGTIYTHFADLDALALHVNARTLSRLAGALDTIEREDGGSGIAGQLCAMAYAYMDFAAGHYHAWSALFEHRMSRPLPDWHREDHFRLFRRIAGKLQMLHPGLPDEAAFLQARTLYAAIHGIVSLGIADRLGRLPDETLREQIRAVVLKLVS
ncbi:AcrR family transcriptional regulator [Pseudochelatococcus lubricantis]|uniref:AcrR family transcriptional regulator n=1 Tax=Pseudochelatococcus lubricantis TaxID=1538102 RepID=A0ABX0V668_9HYPH|nr:TetR/AcrR family transcriptional regulator [Pseudochelatococcus lubricantis]NIJ59990.1 AcrR family transcriptional regulator [Pseudochelatococcus lubricantis]